MSYVEEFGGGSSAGIDTDARLRITNLEDIIYELEIFENITTITGTLTKPVESTIILDQYEDAGDCLVLQVDTDNRPIDKVAVTAGGVAITSTLDVSGNFALSGTPSPYPVALIYQIQIKGVNLGNVPLNNIIDQSELITHDNLDGVKLAGVGVPYGHVDDQAQAIAGVKTFTEPLGLTETTTPIAVADQGKIYTKSDNELYFQDGTGTEKIVGTAILTATIQMYAGATAPTGWELCIGTALSRTTYVTLFSVIGTTYGIGDGSTTFNIPDMRAATPTGVGTSTGYTENETITLGDSNDDQGQGHWHDVEDTPTENGIGPSAVASGTGAFGIATGTAYKARTIITDTENGSPRVGKTTHGKQVGVNFIIKL